MGAATGAERLQWRVVDLLTHGWDLVQATGIAAELSDDLAEHALTFAQAQLPSKPRAGRFADPQPIRDNAPAIAGLAAFPAGRFRGRHERIHQTIERHTT